MSRRVQLIAAAVLATAGAIGAAGGLGSAADPKGSLSCVQPLDAVGIDRVLADAGSPLAGQGAVFVNAAAASGLDPRALVAIAAHETILMTYAPAAAIHNPFGIGPGRAFAADADAIVYAAQLLATNYVGEGRRTLAEISSKWAPVGAANDPTNLNANWVAGVGTSYARLGGNPDASITLDSQTVTNCQAAPVAPQPPAQPATGTAAAGIVTWNGAPPVIDAPQMDRGADPRSGQPATLAGFVFPLVPSTTTIRVGDDFGEPGKPGCYGRQVRCSVSIVADPNLPVVASVAGVLTAASAGEQDGGIAFWITTPDGDRIGYSGLGSYLPGIGEGVAVVAGQQLGTSTRTMRFAWSRIGYPINPAPLLVATFPAARA